MRLRLGICCLLPALAGAADRLPDMRWFFDRALRIEARAGADRYERVSAWAAIPLLFPEDEPGFENDEVWRFVARGALARLDASAAGFPQPAPPAPLFLPPPDPLRDLLGAVLTAHAFGGLQVERAAPASGLRPGDRLLACDGEEVPRPEDAAQRLLAAAERGRAVLALADGRTLTVRIGRSLAMPRLAVLHLPGPEQAWHPPRRWRLPLLADAWLVSGGGTADLDGLPRREPPGASGWTAVAAAGARLDLRRGAATAIPLRGEWREALPRLILGVRAGSALVIESEGPPHVLAVTGPDGRWSDGEPAPRHRLVRHGPPGAMAEAAIEANGMVAIAVRPEAGEAAAVRLRILAADPGEGDRP